MSSTALTVSIAWLAGCSEVIEGSWKGASGPDGTAAAITQAEFKENGDFVAVERQPDGEIVTLRGKYEFDGVSLRLMQPRKPDAIYGAAYNSFTRSLVLRRDGTQQTLSRM